jgi:hypothetical protein
MFDVPNEGYISSKPMHRACDFGEVLDESAVEIAKSEKTLYVLLGFWDRPVDNTLDLDRVHGYLVVRDDHSKVFNLRPLELAFFWLEVQVILLEALENLVHQSAMFSEILGGNDHIVDVNENLSGGNLFFEHFRHHPLKGGGGVAEAEEHNEWLIETTIGLESRFVLISRIESDVVIT